MPLFAWVLAGVGAIGAIIGIYWFAESRFKKAADPAVVQHIQEEVHEVKTELGRIAEYLDGLPQAPPKIKDPFEEGMALKKKYKYEEAIRLFRQALAMGATGSQKAALLLLIGNCFMEQSKFSEAEGHYKEAATAATEASDQPELANIYNNIGLIHKSKGDYNKALDWYHKSLKIMEQVGNQAGLAANYNNIGGIYHFKGDYDKALDWLQKDLKITERIGDQAGLATTYNNIGAIHKSKGAYKMALAYTEKALNIFVKLGAEAKAKQVRDNIEAIKSEEQRAKKLLNLPGKVEISDVTKELEDSELGESPGRSST